MIRELLEEQILSLGGKWSALRNSYRKDTDCQIELVRQDPAFERLQQAFENDYKERLYRILLDARAQRKR